MGDANSFQSAGWLNHPSTGPSGLNVMVRLTGGFREAKGYGPRINRSEHGAQGEPETGSFIAFMKHSLCREA